MKTLLIVCLALTLACAMFVPQVMAKGEKIEICHIIEADGSDSHRPLFHSGSDDEGE
jgi:hypothetical protein